MLRNNRIHIRPFTIQDAEDRLKLQLKNRAFFEQYSMIRSDDFYTLETQQKMIEDYEHQAKKDAEYQFGIYLNETNQLLGTISLFQVMRHSLQSAVLGYFLDQDHNGKGYTTEAVKLILEYAFNELKLHRIEAGVMPHNLGSIRVLEKAGFHKEGLAKQNVLINGKWEDHVMLAVLNPEDCEGEQG
ncbi:GNAT family N-acetyltransferase [Metabacillus indicus]|uniref:GNAT family N-acetyltransferase n=1 Tax=Metabacillus indicus TaxID=246786 RepID=UPI002491A4DE|nr:GNAT family protein [Metabacillus indicus]